MFATQKWKCSWSLISVTASVLALVSVVHLFLFPLVPSLDYLNLRQSQNYCTPLNGSIGVVGGKLDQVVISKDENRDGSKNNLRPIVDLKIRYPPDSHDAVSYRDAPWKAEIGRWLSGCDTNAAAVEIIEEIGGKNCENDCSGQGTCNRDSGKCRCFHGFTGKGCSERLELGCNYPGSKDSPYGPWLVSICSTHCDTTRAMCFCGEGTRYPNRPVAESCGFTINEPFEPGGPRMTDWTKADMGIFSTNASNPGWCDLDPAEFDASKIRIKEQCDCKYDGQIGPLCEVPVSTVCINQCSGNGHCRGGACQCENGWYGADCSIPSVLSSMGDWPKWLRPANVSIPDSRKIGGNHVNHNAAVPKKRPLIYVYDLPPDFNSHLLEGRHFKMECVNRLYEGRNATFWFDQLYGAQMAIYESLLASPHRTLNGDEADYYFVPVLDSCIIVRADDSPHLSMRDHQGLRSSLTLDFHKRAYEHIMLEFPYWNRSSGKDHIWFFSWDEGACYAPKEIWSSMMLVHWGNTNSKHKNSTTAYWADVWDSISPDRRGNHPCFDPEKDLVLPAWKSPDVRSLSDKLWSRPRVERKTLFYFNGNLGPAYEYGRPEDTYSMGIRQKVAEEFGSSPNKKGELGKQHAEDVIVTQLRAENYHEQLANSTFCGVMPGDGWSGRMEDSILQGCIPVVMQDGIYLPYENFLNYDSFAVRIREDEIPNLIKVLRSINETEVEFKLANVKKIWQRFLYRDSIMLEADRQNTTVGFVEDWAVKFSELEGDDVLATLLQVLHYKLHNDPWRRDFVHSKKDFGLPRECLIV